MKRLQATLAELVVASIALTVAALAIRPLIPYLVVMLVMAFLFALALKR